MRDKYSKLTLEFFYYAEKRILDFFARRKDEKNRKIIATFDEYLEKNKSKSKYWKSTL